MGSRFGNVSLPLPPLNIRETSSGNMVFDHTRRIVYARGVLVFWMTFFPNKGQGVLRGKWTINAVRHPYDHEQYNYLGYSIEDQCTGTPWVPFDERKRRAWLFAKQATYFYKWGMAWDRTWFKNLTRDVPGLEIKGGFSVDERYQWNPDKDGHFDDVPGGLDGVENVGKIGPERFNEELSHSRVLLGVGDPWYSPSPFYSLCFVSAGFEAWWCVSER